MKKSTYARAGFGLVAGAALALTAPLAASAHVHVNPGEAAAGSSTILSFTIGHGCDGSPTTGVSITIPDEIVSAKPVVNAGWTATSNTEAVEGVTDQHGDPISERTSAVDFTAKTPLDAEQIDMLSVEVALPEDTAGETLAFPVTQTCETGEVAWDAVAAEGEDEPEHPAPTITVGDVDESGHGHGSEAAHDEAADAAAATQNDDATDQIARIIGIAGLVVGAAGIVIAALSRRPRTKETK